MSAASLLAGRYGDTAFASGVVLGPPRFKRRRGVADPDQSCRKPG